MLVSVAVVPPADVVEEVAALVARVVGAAEELTLVGVESLRLPVIGLGNVTRLDAHALCEALADHVARLGPAPGSRWRGPGRWRTATPAWPCPSSATSTP